MKIKGKYWIIGISACLLIFMVKMCESEDFIKLHNEDKKMVDDVKQMQNTSDSLLTEVIKEVEDREKDYNKELDSLNKLISNKGISKYERAELERRIKDTQKLLEAAKTEKDTVILEVFPIVEIQPLMVESRPVNRDSVVYNIIKKDSIVYNIIERDTIVPKIVYEIDTIHYDSDDIKKLKIK